MKDNMKAFEENKSIKKKISIVATYINRKKVFEQTLKSISESKHNNFEFIVVDDGSEEDQRIEDLEEKYKFLRVIRIDKKDKWYTNPSIPFNIGFGQSTGEIIIIQNAECLHASDIMSFVNYNLNENDYLTFSTYSLSEEQTNRIYDIKNNIIKNSKEIIQPEFINKENPSIRTPGWFNHNKYRKTNYHFCSAIYRTKLSELNGFDERYGTGISYDDDEFLRRIYRLNLNVKLVDNHIVYHQFHGHPIPFYNNLVNKNKILFDSTKNENIIKVNQNKKILKDEI